MTLFVLCLVIIDVFILGTYTINEGAEGNLGVKLIPNREMHEETIGVRDMYNWRAEASGTNGPIFPRRHCHTY